MIMKKCSCDSCHTDGNEMALACDCGSANEYHHEQEHSQERDHSHGGEQISSLKQDIISVIAAAVVAVAAYFTPYATPYPAVQIALYLAAILIAGLPVFREGIKGIFHLQLEEMALMTIAVTAACIIGEFPEAMLVTVLFRLGEILEDLAVSRSRREVEAITKIIPENANLLGADGAATVVGAKELALGSKILIKSGERVPVDCRILSGSSSLDTSSLTGESIAREVSPGELCLSGSINLGGSLVCETVSTFADSTAAKIVEMVRDSAAQKGNTERFITRFARVYTPLVILAAVLLAVAAPLLGLGTFTMWLSRALVLLVASCPCALVISIPLSFFAGIGACSKNGVLVKGSKYMEALAQADTVVFDKTGTLTTGALSVDTVTAARNSSREEVLRLSALCESYSNHPIAKAVVSAHGAVDTAEVEECRELTSYGMRAVLKNGDVLLCGSRRLMERFDVPMDGLPEANVYLARGGAALGAVSVCDSPRPDAADTILELKELGIRRTVMLTGDGGAAAEKTRALVGLDEARHDLLPADKVENFAEIKKTSAGKTIYVGDGINDAPVLAAADAGVAMGLASDAAIETADVVLLSDKLRSLPQAIRITRRVTRLARFNVAFALTVKALVFVLTVFGMATMWMAVFADVGVSILAVLNATRALRF